MFAFTFKKFIFSFKNFELRFVLVFGIQLLHANVSGKKISGAVKLPNIAIIYLFERKHGASF